MEVIIITDQQMVVTPILHRTTAAELMAVDLDQLYKVDLEVADQTLAVAEEEATTEAVAEAVLAAQEMAEKVDLTTLVAIVDLQQLHQLDHIQIETLDHIQLAMVDMALLETMEDFG